MSENSPDIANKKIKVMIFIPHYLPGYKYGGPVKSVASILTKLGDYIQFYLVTSCSDVGQSKPYNGVNVDQWVTKGSYKVMYSSRKGLDRGLQFGRLIKQIQPDVIYLNSVFNIPFGILPFLVVRWHRYDCKTLIAPRGEFSDGALSLKARKKNLFILIAFKLKLYRNVSWHVTNEQEQTEVFCKTRSEGRSFVVSNIVSLVTGKNETKRLDTPSEINIGVLKLVFLSRITPKKNLLYTLNVLCCVKASVRFTIYGPVEDRNYWDECLDCIARLPDNIEIVIGGVVDPENVVSELSQHDLFFFPTLGENFGHVIVEALNAGLLLLISDETPWRDLQEKCIGQEYSLAYKENFVGYIEHLACSSVVELEQMKSQVSVYLHNVSADSLAVEGTRKMFVDMSQR